MKKAIFLSLLIIFALLLLGLPSVSAPGVWPPPTYYSVPSNETFVIPIKMRFDDVGGAGPGYFSAIFYWDNNENDSNAPYVNFTYEGFKCWFTDGTNFSGPITDNIIKQVPVGYPAGYYRYAISILESYGENHNGEFWLNITMRAAGILNGSYIPHFGWEQKITFAKVRCREITEASFGPLALTIHTTPRILSSDQTGAPKEVFNATLGEEVYVKGFGFSNSTTGTTTRMYVVQNATWTDNQAIGTDIRGAYSMANVDSIGNLTATSLGLLPAGEYDIVADASMDGFYNVTTDAIDDATSTPGVIVTEVPVHDVAIITVSPSPTVVYQGEVVNVTVVTKNEGTLSESFNVTAYYNDTIGTQAVANLAPGANTTLTFKWNTTNVTPGNYTISANATVVPGEVDTADNTKVDGSVVVTHTQFTLLTLYKVNLNVIEIFDYGNNLSVKFYSYHGVYQGEVAVWSGTTPAYVTLFINVSHPLNWPIENVTLVLTDDTGTILQTITTFLVRRTHLFSRLAQINARWPFASPEERFQLFKEIVDIDMKWPYAPS